MHRFSLFQKDKGLDHNSEMFTLDALNLVASGIQENLEDLGE